VNTVVEDGADDAATTGEDAAGSGTRDADGASDGADSCSIPAAMPQSFTPDTKVFLASGKTIPIDQMKVGEKVRAVDTTTGKTVTRAVTAVWINHDTDLMDVTVTNSAGAAGTGVVPESWTL
jgi:hypothetical protein